jgi:hypothetical protein
MRGDVGCCCIFSAAKESLVREEPKLLHLLVILGYQLLLLLSLIQAAGRQAPYRQTGMIGAYRLQISAASAPLAWQRLALTVSAQGAGSGIQMALVMPAPTTSAAQHATEIPLAITRAPHGICELGIRPLPPGLWFLRLVVQGGQGAASGVLPFRVAAPPAPPPWLVWRMGLLTLALLIYATWVHNRRDAQDAYTLAPESRN